MLKQQLVTYAKEQFGCKVDTPFAKYPDYLVLRHPSNGKWAGAVLQVPASKVGGEGDHIVDALNVKLDPLLVESLRTEPGYAPAWHMSKTHWLTIRLDGSVPFDQMAALFEMSFNLVSPKRKRSADRR